MTEESAAATPVPIVNVSAYKFVELDDLSTRKKQLLDRCQQLELKGTILLSSEGINMFVAGDSDNIDRLLIELEATPEYAGLPIKKSPSDHQPFTRMLVRIKKEIIAFGVEGIAPHERTSPKLDPKELKKWLDDGRDVTLLDVRNDYEVDLGTFDGALPIGVDSFRDFPEAVEKLPDELKKKPIVMFCTGGIRCEKAGPFMEREGFENIYQLDGGILKYFEDCGGDHYDGECFVFDKRVAVDSDLNETNTEQCFACQHPLTDDDQASKLYVPGESCAYCYRTAEETLQERIMIRQAALDQVSKNLPGSVPYDNSRPLNVPGRFDQMEVVEFLSAFHPHVENTKWESAIETGKIIYKNQPVQPGFIVRSGMRLDHLIPGTVEPEVNGNIQLLFEDDDLIVINKPAPIPMHPCGRFNRNTIIYMLNGVYQGEKIRMAHRLDANTSGCVVLGRKRLAIQRMQVQFEKTLVRKEYLACVHGTPKSDQFSVDAAIAKEPDVAGVRLVDHEGLPALTNFEVLQNRTDGTTLIRCVPKTGRTNQIRIHLWHLGLPIVGDPIYLKDQKLGNRQTKAVGEPPMCLHAFRLGFEHPSNGQDMIIEAPSPEWADSF